MNKLRNVSSSPHARGNVLTQNLMFDVAIAMVPAAVYGVYQFGLKALCILLVTMAGSVLSEYVYESLSKAALRRSGTELYEPGSGSQMFSSDLICQSDVSL